MSQAGNAYAKAHKKQKEAIKEYLESRHALVCDESGSCRSSVSKALVEMGLPSKNLFSSPAFDQAVDDITANNTQIVITDYQIGTKSGLDLIHKQREVVPDDRERLFVLATGNSSETAVAEAAEEDVDAFVIKPFTGNSLMDQLYNAILKKMKPSEYVLAIEDGKLDLVKKELDPALEKFEKAKSLNDKPTLAHYYQGVTQKEKDDLDQAIAAFEEGLKINEIHYKCLVGAYEAYEKKNFKDKAYEKVRTIVDHFPVSANRLGRMFRLAVHTGNFQDLGQYYDTYTKLDPRPEELTKTVCAGLIVTSKYYLKKGDNAPALDALTKVMVSSQRKPAIVYAIVDLLVGFELFNEADGFLKQMDVSHQVDPDYKVHDLMITNGISDANAVAAMGRALLAEGIKDPKCYLITIQRLSEIGNRSAEDIAYDATSAFPDMKEQFFAALGKGKQEEDEDEYEEEEE